MTAKDPIAEHYSRGLNVEYLLEQIDQAIPGKAAPGDFAPIDQLHLGGRKATLELLDGLKLSEQHRVLDVGCGLGGSARLVAERYGCDVVGLDITADFCQLAVALNQRLKQPLRVSVIQADASRLPFSEHSIDVVISQHCMMNLPQPALALSEFKRVLRPNGQLVLHEVLQGNGGAIRYPVPWASAKGQSYLVAEPHLRQLINNAGFEVVEWIDQSQQALAWRRHLSTTPARTGLTPSLIFGPRFADMSQNLATNLIESRIQVVSIVAQLANMAPPR